MKRLIEWDSLDVRVSGEKLSEMVREQVAAEPMIERIALKFSNGLLRVEGSIRKFISVPFTVEITNIAVSGTTVRVPLARISAGPLPIPTLLVGLVRDRFPKNLVRYEEPATLVVSLDRFLPPFVAADLQKIWIIDGGLAVTLGRGGADLPGGAHDAGRPEQPRST
jgi:hypothetical protein